MLSRDSHGPRAVLNALDRLAGSYEGQCELAGQELAIAEGRIPESFRPRAVAWRERNVTRFGEPKHSGDDCHETAAVQQEYLRIAGFRDVRTAWSDKLWGILFGRR
jgi:hypothetical protein